jgi:uncharacterized phiE125 gp8 family phage protein
VFKLIEAASEEPVTVAELRTHLRITSTEQDTMLLALIKTARLWAEDFLRFQIVSATWEKYFDAFPLSGREIWLQKSPVSAVTYIHYLNSSGVETTWSSDEWTADYNSTPCRVYEKYGYTYPTPQATQNSVWVRFVAGYASAADVPEIYKQGIKMKAGTLYENPTDEVTGTQVNKLDLTAEKLLRPFRATRF